MMKCDFMTLVLFLMVSFATFMTGLSLGRYEGFKEGLEKGAEKAAADRSAPC
jgi:hypothetical protein